MLNRHQFVNYSSRLPALHLVPKGNSLYLPVSLSLAAVVCPVSSPLLWIQDELLIVVFSAFHLLLEWDYGFQAPYTRNQKPDPIPQALIIPLKAESWLNSAGWCNCTKQYPFGNQDLPPLLLFLPVGLSTASSSMEGRQMNICVDAA